MTLFSDCALSDYLQDHARYVDRKLHEWNPDKFLSTPADDLVEKLTEACTVKCPVLLRDRAEQLPPQERTVRVSGAPHPGLISGGTSGRDGERVVRFEVLVPIEGQTNLFHVRPPRTPVGDHWHVELSSYPDRLRILKEGPLEEPKKVAAYFTEILDGVEAILEEIRREVTTFNERLRSEMPERVAARRAELVAIRDVQQSIGLPVHEKGSRNSRDW